MPVRIVVSLCYVTHHQRDQSKVTRCNGGAHQRDLSGMARVANLHRGGPTLCGSTVSLSPLVPRRETYLAEGTLWIKDIGKMPGQRACRTSPAYGYPQGTQGE